MDVSCPLHHHPGRAAVAGSLPAELRDVLALFLGRPVEDGEAVADTVLALRVRAAQWHALAGGLGWQAARIRCELTRADNPGRECPHRAVAAAWRQGFVDHVCQLHAVAAVDAGDLVVPYRHADGYTPPDPRGVSGS